MKTIISSSFTETEEKKSRFLTFLLPYDTFKGELSRLKEAHPKANHHVTAFRYFDKDKRIVEGAKDDGEPSGTSGMPALKVLQGNELINTGVVIVRYFGGTKLGTGGLTRAYGGAVKAVIEEASLIDFNHQSAATLKTNFARISNLERLLSSVKLTILQRRYTEDGQEIDISGDEEIISHIQSQWDLLNF